MASIKLIFYGTEKSKTDECELVCYVNNQDEIFLQIESDGIQQICLDKSTAIKLAKTLRTEINKIGGVYVK